MFYEYLLRQSINLVFQDDCVGMILPRDVFHSDTSNVFPIAGVWYLWISRRAVRPEFVNEPEASHVSTRLFLCCYFEG